MARKQVARSLPSEWSVQISFAGNGHQALDAIRAGQGDIVFLDLTMPDMDGFTVLQKIRDENLKCVVIVISADIQPVARQRVLELGALEFIRKPINPEILKTTLDAFGLI